MTDPWLDLKPVDVAKFEGGQVSPSMKALQRYATATGARLKIRLAHADAR